MTNFEQELAPLRLTGTQYKIYQDGKLPTFNQLAHLWRTSTAFALWYSKLLAASPFEAFLWEHPPVLANALDQPYELVLQASPTLAN